MDGLLNVNKPAGWTSHDVVQRVRRLSGEKHVGHAGTLDPGATGVLPLGLGHGTRVLEFVSGPKLYRAAIEFGVVTDTFDAEGQVEERHDASHLTRRQVEEALPQYRGTFLQRPPAYSAVKHQGRRLYQYARQGIAVEVPPRPVHVAHIELTAWEPPVARVEVECSRGTYLRALAHDLGRTLGCGAILRDLVRARDGAFTLEDSHTLEELAAPGRLAEMLLPLDYPLQHWPAVTLLPPRDAHALQGGVVPLLPGDRDAVSRVLAAMDAGEEKVYCRGRTADRKLLALLEYTPQKRGWHPFKVFPPRDTGQSPAVLPGSTANLGPGSP